MATVQYMLNALMIALTLTSRSSDAVQRAPCHKAFDAYFRNWKVNAASLANLLDQDKELSFEDVNNLFMPICDVHGNYATKQCLMNSYCWCSDPNGELLSGTFQKGKADELDCSKLAFACINVRDEIILFLHYSKMHGGKHLLHEW